MKIFFFSNKNFTDNGLENFGKSLEYLLTLKISYLKL